ncbi:MAG: PKD domain-containing protein [Bacteroidetes bacterium]|nr:PKD domain-containing protein [Bacteroidota bacterium]
MEHYCISNKIFGRENYLITLLFLLFTIYGARASDLMRSCQSGNSLGQAITESEKQTILKKIADLPIMFRKNMGQWDGCTAIGENKILYRGSSPGWNANVYFMKDHLSFGFRREKEIHTELTPGKRAMDDGKENTEYLVWNMWFKGMNSDLIISNEGEQNSQTNYLLGNDPSKYCTNVPDYKMIRYNDIYKQIDLRYYSNGTELKYDFIVKAGGDINKIQLGCEGIKRLQINEEGNLIISTAWGDLIEQIPESYQDIGGNKKQIRISYKLINDTTFGFVCDQNYDKQIPLVIDPVNLVWSTYVGPLSGSSEGYIFDMALDPAGNVYGTGWFNDKFPTMAGVFDQTFNNPLTGVVANDWGNSDAYVFKLSANGSSLIYATYIGGTLNENLISYAATDVYRAGIAVNASGEVFISGSTYSTNFPTTPGAYDVTHNGGTDAFVLKLNATGTTLMYSTFLGGSGEDSGFDIAINAAGEAFVTGFTASANFPVTAGAFDLSFNGGAHDLYVTKLNASGAGLSYSTYLGGSSDDRAYGIVLNASGQAFLTGATSSPNFSVTAGAYDVSYNGGLDAFVTRVNAAGSNLIYSTYLGGAGAAFNINEAGQAIAINASDEAFVTGETSSSDFPVTPGAYDVTYNAGQTDAFVTKLTSSGAFIIYSTFVGGSTMEDHGFGIAVNSVDEVYVSGISYSTNFPVTPCAYQSTKRGWPDIILFKLNNTLSTMLYATYMGGTGDFNYYVPKVCLRGPCQEEVISCGTTHTSNFPTTAGSFQPAKIGLTGFDERPVVFKFKPNVTPNFTFTASPNCNSSVQFTDASTGTCVWNSGAWTASSWKWDFGDGTTSNLKNPTHIYTTGGTYNVKLVIACPADSITIPVTVTSVSCCISSLNPTINIVHAGCGNNGSGSIVSVSGGTSPYTYSWSPSGGTNASATGLSPGSYNVTISDAANCKNVANIQINNSQLVISTSVQGILCNGSSNGTASVLIAGSTSPYTYNWSNGQTTQVSTGLSAGNYTVTVRDVNGCSVTKVVTITPKPPVAYTVTPTNGTCGNPGSASITVTGGAYSYLWSNSQTTASVTGLSAGTYSVTVTDGNGCVGTRTFSISIAANPNTATFTQSPSGIVCLGTNVTFTNTGSTGTYNWLVSPANVSGSTVNFSYTFLSTGSYTISHTVTSGGCSKQETSTVSVINCTSGPSVAATGSSVCPGSCGTVTASGTGGTSPYTYSWSNGATTQNISPCPASTTTYTVTIRDTGGNTSTSTAVVTVNPAISVNTTATNLACNGATNGSSLASPANGTAPYTYSWSNNQTTQTATGLLQGNYTVIVTDNKGCTAVSTTTLTEPIAITASTTPTAAGCGVSNGGATVSAGGGTGGLTYTWSTSATGQTISAVAAGTYTVTVRDGNNCTKTAIAVISNFPSPAINSLTGNNLQCSGGNNGTAIVAASGGTGTLTYNWSNTSSGVTSITGLTAGTYVVSVRDASGCLVVSTVSITEPGAITFTTNGVNANCGNSNGSVSVVAGGGTGTLIYNWSNSSTGQLVTGLGAGIYTLTITDANSCVKTATATVNNINGATVTTTVQANVTCNGGTNGSALANPVGGTTPYTYSWSNGQTAPTATGLGAGSYTITITDASGCSSIANAVIISPAALTGEFAKGTSNCSGCGCKEWIMVTAAGGTSPYSYTWPDGYANRYKNLLCPGNYSVNITDKNGCSINVNVSAP